MNGVYTVIQLRGGLFSLTRMPKLRKEKGYARLALDAKIKPTVL